MLDFSTPLDDHNVGEFAFSRGLIASLIERHEKSTLPRLDLLWTYYRNPMHLMPTREARPGAGEGRRRLGQERGLPARLTGAWSAGEGVRDDRTWSRKEIVIENDIGWRIHTMVDFMFGRPVAICSTAADAGLRRRIERALDEVWEASGGIGLMQDMGLLGHVYGHVDLVVRSHEGLEPRRHEGEADTEAVQDIAGQARRATEELRIEVVDPTRGIALLDEHDYRNVSAYIIRCRRESGRVRPAASGWGRLAGAILGREVRDASERETVITTEVLARGRRWVYEQEAEEASPRLVESSPTRSAGVPVVHIQNISQPLSYEGMGEVEGLIPLQDELNTRLSDRASRVTLQSFKMYLVKGMEAPARAGVGPGQVWLTDNPDAAVDQIGGDAASPSEDAHIEQVREALDKASGVPPLASGVVRAKIGNLTSENALRVTLMGLLSKTARKRITYGRGIAAASRLVLEALDSAGVLATSPEDRGVRVEWPDPLPRDEAAVLSAAMQKVELGVPRERVLSELGYAPTDPGIV